MPLTITKPVPGGSADQWGDLINDALDDIVDAVNGNDANTPLNLLDGATAETVVNSKAVIYGNAGEVVATSLALDNANGDWTFEVSSDKLIIKYGGTAKLEIDTDGNFKAVGNVETNGTIS